MQTMSSAKKINHINIKVCLSMDGTIIGDNHDHDPGKLGFWEPIRYHFKYLPVHVALLHTGKVLAFGGSGNEKKNLKNPHPAEIFEPNHIGKDDGKIYEIPEMEPSIRSDIFCAGHTFLPDGRLLVAGGTYKYDVSIGTFPIVPFSGLERSYTFDPIGLSWNRIDDMSYGRWYPTCVLLSDGRVLVVAGLTKRFPWAFLNKLEIYSDEKGWKPISGADRWIPMYPRIHLLPSGELFYAGSYNTHYTFPFFLRAFPSATYDISKNRWKTIGLPLNIKREEGTSVLLPLLPPNYTARVLLIAGGLQPGNVAINHVEMIDFSDKAPKYKSKAPLTHERYYCYAVLLPDQNVMVLGGKKGVKSHHKTHRKDPGGTEHLDINSHSNHAHANGVETDPLAVREPELYNIIDDKWYPMAHMGVDRLYHASALLLPDGRIMTAGSNPDRGENELRIELFHPPYLFQRERPKITDYPTTLNYGQEFEFETDDASDITAVAIMRPSVTTHCVDTDQRYVGLGFKHKTSHTISAKVPANKNIAPPGYYMLFAIIENTPSIAPFLLLS